MIFTKPHPITKFQSTLSAENETGRSMVEILGVLAIVAVLSVASLTGFSILQDKHLANTITNDIQILVLHINATKSNTTPTDYKSTSNKSTSIELFSDGFEITLANIPSATCAILLQNPPLSSDSVRTISDTGSCDSEMNDIVFSFPFIDVSTTSEDENCTQTLGYIAPSCDDHECCTLTGRPDICGKPTAVIGQMIHVDHMLTCSLSNPEMEICLQCSDDCLSYADKTEECTENKVLCSNAVYFNIMAYTCPVTCERNPSGTAFFCP